MFVNKDNPKQISFGGILKDMPRRKRLAIASEILSRRRRIKHSCKSRRLTYPFRGFNYLRGNVGASFEFFS